MAYAEPVPGEREALDTLTSRRYVDTFCVWITTNYATG
jgi:hypothetical protein